MSKLRLQTMLTTRINFAYLELFLNASKKKNFCNQFNKALLTATATHHQAVAKAVYQQKIPAPRATEYGLNLSQAQNREKIHWNQLMMKFRRHTASWKDTLTLL